MTDLTPREICQILETPIGITCCVDATPQVAEGRLWIRERYRELTIDLSFSEASLRARTEWLTQHVRAIT